MECASMFIRFGTVKKYVGDGKIKARVVGLFDEEDIGLKEKNRNKLP